MASCLQCSLATTASISCQRSLGGALPLSQSLSLSQTPSSSTFLCARHAQAAQVASRKALVRAEATDVADGAVGVASDVEIQDPSAFISDVAGLIKLVDSRDIVELEMKHANYEIVIRKKEALEQNRNPNPQPQGGYQTFPGPHVMAHTAFPFGTFEQMAPSQAPPPAPAPSAPAAPAEPAAPAKAPPPGLPPMLSPMAGTFYRSAAPGEPPFIKVGDRITKGQVVCIIEAMKLMNEIEADQSGVVVDIVAQDGKAVSIESPLLVIKP